MNTPSQAERDRFLVFETRDVARHYAPWYELTADEQAALLAIGKRSNRAEQAQAGKS